MVERSEVRVVRCSGTKINFLRPIITNDNKFLLCAAGDEVKVFSTSTEECVHVLQAHRQEVTGLALNPANHLQVYSCSLDGTIRLWDFTDGILIKTFTIEVPIFSMYVSERHVGIVFLILRVKDESQCFQLLALRLPVVPKQVVKADDFYSVLSNVSPNPEYTAFGRQGEYIASVKDYELKVYFFKNQETCSFFLKNNYKNSARNTFTCIACNPKDDCIASGHKDGKIRLWRNFNQKNYTHSTQHWHHNAVATLCFTPDGTHLLSGGLESVLVQWHCVNVNKTGFLPRLGGAITHISVSPDGQMYSTSHSGNKITLVHCSFKVSAVIQGLVNGDAVLTDLVIDPRSKALVLNGNPGHLQFYSLHRDKLIYNLDIVQQEYIHEECVKHFEVVNVAFDVQGSWMATVEEGGHAFPELEFYLKLWGYKENNQSFELNTTITAAHNDRILSMCFSPSTETTMLVTAARDSHFKVWLLGSDSEPKNKQPSWSCDYVGSYHGLAPTNCCFSSDGSLLAVSFGEVVTVWSPDTWGILTTLCQPPGAIKDLCFGRFSCSKYLLGTTKYMLCCWNLLTCSLEWSTSMEVCRLQSDPLSENIAAFCFHSENTDSVCHYAMPFPPVTSPPVFVFRPSEPRPLFTQKAVCSGNVQHCVFAPREVSLDSCDEKLQWLNRSRLYFFNEQMDLLTFSTRTEDEQVLNSKKELLVDDSVAMTPFYLLLGKHGQQQESQISVANQVEARIQLPQTSVAIKELLHTPAHVLPAASFLCSLFVNSLLITNSAGNTEGKEPLEEEMESEKEEESEEETEPCDDQQVIRTHGSVEEVPVLLSKAEEKELKRVRKTDFNWATNLAIS